MLDSLWADHPGLRCVAGIKGKTTHHYWFETTDEAYAKAATLDADGWNVYFSPSLYDPEKVAARREEINPRTKRNYTGREQDCAALLPALWLDLDCGEGKDYPTQRDALVALSAWVAKVGVPSPSYIVSSGYGIHVYWQLDHPVPQDRWLPVAKHLKQACRVHGLLADPARTSDASSLMRYPGTRNRKKSDPADVVVLGDSGETVDLQAFRARLPVVGPVGAVASAVPSPEWDTSVKLPPGDANRIADKCGQMGQMRFHKGKVAEPVWRAALSVLWRCEDAEYFIHEWSKGDPRYDADQTQAKAEDTRGPATCAHFSELNPEGCAGCPFAGSITSPINIAYAEELPEPAEEGQDGPTKVHGYVVTKEGLFQEPTGGEGPLTKIADFPVWIEEAREFADVGGKSNMRASLTLAWYDSRGAYHTGTLSQAELFDKRGWTTWLADNNLASFVVGDRMAQYISRMNKARFKEKGARTIYDRLGWYENHSLFVTGKQGIRSTGVEDVLVEASGNIGELKCCGDLAAWKAGMALLGKARYRGQAFGLLVGFAAPLLDLVGKQGAVVALVGESGKGKTLGAECGLSIYGDPKRLQGSGRDTLNGIGIYLGQLRHVPALVDEVTTMKDAYLRDLIYMAANGADKASLTQKREMRSGSTWRTITMLTSNHSIVDRHQKDIEEAHRRRLVEIPVLEGVSQEDGERLGQLIQSNYGVAAAPYMQLVMEHKDKIPALFTMVEKQINKWGYGDPADRFGTWTCTAALLGGILAYAAGVIPFNPTPVVKAVCQASSGNNDQIQTPAELAREVLDELLVTHSKRICVWTSGKLALDDTDDAVARIAGGKLYIKMSELRKAWDDAHVYHRAIKEWLESVAPRGRMKVRLSPTAPTSVWAYEFDMAKLGIDTTSLVGGVE